MRKKKSKQMKKKLDICNVSKMENSIFGWCMHNIQYLLHKSHKPWGFPVEFRKVTREREYVRDPELANFTVAETKYHIYPTTTFGEWALAILT